MRIATLALTLTMTLAVAGCSRIGGDSGLNPLGWMRSTPKTLTTLEPKKGWTSREDQRPLVPQILSAGMQPLNEGKLLIVSAFAPVKGWWDLEIISERRQPGGQLRPDDDGILRLMLVGLPPVADETIAVLPANPQSDVLTIALPLSTLQLSRLREIQIRAGQNGMSLKP